MNIRNWILVAITVSCAVLIFFLDGFSNYLCAIYAICAITVVLFPKREQKPIVCALGGLRWSQDTFCHNFLISGAIGSGKSVCLLNVLDQVMRNVPSSGGLWLDNKGDSCMDLLRIAKKHGRMDDIIIIEVPFDGKRVYPPQRLNLLTAGGMTPDTVPKILADISLRGESKSKNSDFFHQQTCQHISGAIRFFHDTNRSLTISALSAFLCDLENMFATVKELPGQYELLIQITNMIQEIQIKKQIRLGVKGTG